MKSFNLISKCNFIVFCLICLCSLFYINCETCDACTNNGLKCTGDGCSPSCKPHFLGTSSPNLCISCTNSGYYSITSSTCDTCRGNRIIDDTQECINADSCDYLYSMENVCYSTCPEYSIAIGSECHCLYKYYIITAVTIPSTIEGGTPSELKKRICLPPNTVLPEYIYYKYGSNELYKDSCPSSYNYIKEEIIGGQQVKRCSQSCIGNEFHLTDGTNNYCLDSCLNTQKIYIDGSTRKCVNDCSFLNSGSIEFIEKNNNCIKKEECSAIYNNKCYDSCSEIGYYKNMELMNA